MIGQVQRGDGCIKKADNVNETKLEIVVGKASTV